MFIFFMSTRHTSCELDAQKLNVIVDMGQNILPLQSPNGRGVECRPMF